MKVYGYEFDQTNYFLNLRLKSLLPLNFGKLDYFIAKKDPLWKFTK
jgi:hypothetical protein